MTQEEVQRKEPSQSAARPSESALAYGPGDREKSPSPATDLSLRSPAHCLIPTTVSRFSIIIGGEDVAEHKPHPSALITAISRMQVDANDVLYIGDNTIDVLTAERAKVSFIAVLSGTTSKSEFKKYPKLRLSMTFQRCLDCLVLN